MRLGACEFVLLVLHLCAPALVDAALAASSVPSAPRPSSALAEPRPRTVAEAKRVDHIARFRALGFPESRLKEFLRSGKGLTTWYNEVAIGGQDAMRAGWVLVSVGAASLIAASVILVWNDRRKPSCPECDGDDDNVPALVTAVLCLGAGSVELLTGIPLAAWGTYQTRRWVKGDLYDRAPIEHLREIRKVTQAGGKKGASVEPANGEGTKRFRLSITPYVAPGGGGLSFSLRF